MKVRVGLPLIAVMGACHAQRAEPERPCPIGPRVVRATIVQPTVETGGIRGTVSDAATLRRLPAATVSILGTAQATRTDSSGAFLLSNGANQDSGVRLGVIAQGYQAHVDTLKLIAGAGLTVSIFMAYSQICLAPVTVGIQ